MASQLPISDLDFVDARLGRPPNYWCVSPVGRSADDEKTGMGYADALCDFMLEHDMPMLLGWVIRAMPPGEKWTALERGFFHGLACRARRP